MRNSPPKKLVRSLSLLMITFFGLGNILGAGILNVMTGRLARIIDRGRRLVEQPVPIAPSMMKTYLDERNNLEKRRYLASAAITACTLSALLICLVIAAD